MTGRHGASGSRARFSIGIDLGTTNSALAFVALAGGGPSEMLAVPQVESPVAMIEAPTLPSFLYLPEDAPANGDLDDVAAHERWVVGAYARVKAAETPGRVVHSAKSWLAHHSADRSAPFLPWGSEDVARDDKLSPVGASAVILRYLREAWNERFAASGEEYAFDAQSVTITVPASFDAVAQDLTLAAARAAGYPENIRLLEEPQAALYRWLELHDAAGDEWSALQRGSLVRHVVVVDIGGGTSDFSLFAFHPDEGSARPRIERIAVSEHILLGGDNIDLALAHRLEPQLVDDGESLSARQWEYLVALSRDIKERALSTVGAADDAFPVSIPGRGSRLIAQAKSAHLTRAQIEGLLLDGFFPECSFDEYPIRARTALRELGLPYARDAAVTRHLADFLRGRPTVDAILFNGGSLYPRRLRERIRAQIARWQSGTTPIVLDNPEPDLAVARGAAYFGKLVWSRARRIDAGAAHAIFLQVQRAAGNGTDADGRAFVCVLPQGAPTEETFTISDLGLELRVNRSVRFQTFSAARSDAQRAGALAIWNERDFHPLPPLETTVNAAGTPNDTLPVRLTARVSELGRLEIACVSADPAIGGSWPLEFDLRGSGTADDGARWPAAGAMGSDDGPGVSLAAVAAARARITMLFGRPVNPRDRLTATRLLKSLEAILALPKSAWNVVLVRSLWSTLDECMTQRARSVEHEEAWLILAGFYLRPGFGAAMDDARIDRLWTLRETGLCHSAKTIKIQEYVLWRRVAGGLSVRRQHAVLEPDLAKIREQTNVPPELVLLAGSFERLERGLKLDLIERFTALAVLFEREKKHNAHYLSALGLLLNRAPLYGGPEIVVPPEYVQRAFEALSGFDWDGPRRLELQTLFLRAARVVDNRGIDVSRSLRNRIADKLEKSGVPATKTAPLRDYLPIARSERTGSFGESLPPGLILRDDVTA